MSAAWTSTLFLNAPAWESQNGPLVAIVSASRCRLLYFGATDRSNNLLSAPDQAPNPSKDEAPNWGGHRFWLGPQARWVWPPLRDWEFAEARTITTMGDRLVVEHPQTDPNYPALIRTYSWEGQALNCTVTWKDDGRAYYGMHVFAVDAPAKLTCSLSKSPQCPEGAVLVAMDGFKTTGLTDTPALLFNGDRLEISSGSTEQAKVGLFPQALELTRRDGWTLRLSPGSFTGIPIGSSDAGLLTQLWVGSHEHSFAELEQLSPILLGGAEGLCSSTCLLYAYRTPQTR